MNISTGGPHILFFERDQQLTALLTSEFQLAGYECHAARTAVEVFDTIARFPVRILLVNLAQAAAGRREFWVALDTQRRGRGVQVFTYLCSNLAGYGTRDIDERPQAQLPDIEIDGMLGLMNFVDAVRERVPGPGSTPTQTRLPKTTVPIASTTAQVPTQTNMSGTNYRTGPIADTPRTGTLTAPVATQAPPSSPMQQSYSEKIRAVLYPTPRPINAQAPATQAETIQVSQETERPVAYTYVPQQNTPHYEQNVPSTQNNQATQPYDTSSTVLQRLAYGQQTEESGLDQLSRLLQERNMPLSNATPNGVPYQMPNEVSENRYTSSTTQTTQNVPPVNYTSAAQTAQSTHAIGTQPLRASPIEDLPLDRATHGVSTSDGGRHSEGTVRMNYSQHGYVGQTQNNQAAPTTQTTPLASISTLRTAAAPAPTVAKATMPMPAVILPQPVEKTTIQEQRVIPPPVQEEHSAPQAVQETLVEYGEEVPIGDQPAIEQSVEDKEERDEVEDIQERSERQEAQEQQSMQDTRRKHDTLPTGIPPNNAMLLDIVQSLPLMPSPPPAPQAVSGRTMRTLGSVLLEGHLVPQSRLEVAQNIQRMLRGVDLNYQLGEILLMFKLLTPDQLLAASLVSYGMISTQQISALGRIRQELHAIGLEYDLESLLILFRMLTPEQLREVRASWQG